MNPLKALFGRGGFRGSRDYWEQRYRKGGNSGAGSYGKFAEFKAEFLNRFVAEHDVRSVIEFGCGDGHQLELTPYPAYLGLDVSPSAIARCREAFAGDATKRFLPVSEYAGETAELALSLDVLYHLVEDEVFEAYMRDLFRAATRFVVIYSSDTDDLGALPKHVRPRRFSPWIEAHAPAWTLAAHVPNRYPYRGDHREGSWSDFFVYARAER